jgi:hypothetical protein
MRKRVIAEMRELALKERVKERWFHWNAAHLFHREERHDLPARVECTAQLAASS